MTVAPSSRDVLQEALDLKAKYGSWVEAARVSKTPVNTLKSRGDRAKLAGLKPLAAPVSDDSNMTALVESLRSELEAARRTIAQQTKPHFTIRQNLQASATKIRAVWSGDEHDGPEIKDKRRFLWTGHYVRETKPDVYGKIGDALTFDSLNTHIPNENYNGKAKPSFIADIASGHEAYDAFDAGLGSWNPEKHVTDGNHERRLYLFEDQAPETIGMMQRDYDHLLESHGFTHSPYGLIQYYGGVGFVHCALNTLGKSYGGKNCLPTIANDSVSDLVIGHSHRARIHQAPKIGQRYPTTIIDLGCALPSGHIEDYAKHALNGWTYGIYDLLIQHGHIQSAKFISMDELEERYGHL